MRDVLPLLAVPWLTALVCLSLGRSRWGARVSLAGAAAVPALALLLAWRVGARGPLITAGGWLHADALSALLTCLLGTVALASAGYGHFSMVREAEGRPVADRARGRYDALFHGLVGTLVLAALADDLVLLWVALEGSTLVAALLVGYDREAGAAEAGSKYLMLCSAGITLALFGTVLLYCSAVPRLGQGGAGLQWTALREAAGTLDPRFVKLAFLFALVGYGTKAGLAPMHTWLPEAHGRAPTPVSALLSAGVLATALTALLRFHAIAVRCLGPGWSQGLLAGFGLLSMVVAVPFVLIQGDYKRLLAYSSVEHTGLVALAVGLGHPLALVGGLFHLLNHALAKTLAFLVGDPLGRAFGSRRMDHWSGVIEASPALGGLFVLAGVALAGLPPLALFLSGWMVLVGGLAAGHVWLVAGAIAALTIVFAGLAYHWTRMALGRPRADFHEPLPAASRWPMWALGAVLLVLGVWLPTPLRALLEQAARVIQP